MSAFLPTNQRHSGYVTLFRPAIFTRFTKMAINLSYSATTSVPYFNNQQSPIINQFLCWLSGTFPDGPQVYKAIFPPGSTTTGSAAVSLRTRSAHRRASCSIGGQVL